MNTPAYEGATEVFAPLSESSCIALQPRASDHRFRSMVQASRSSESRAPFLVDSSSDR